MARRLHLLLAAVMLAFFATAPQFLAACPFCSAVSLTFSEEIDSMDVAVIARLVEAPSSVSAAGQREEVSKTRFEIVDVIKGQELVQGQRFMETLYFGEGRKGSEFLVMGVDPPNLMWSTPLALSERARQYVASLPTVPKSGPERLAFFQDYLEDSDETLARDAYDEFAKAPYDVVRGLKARMKHDQLVEWIQDEDIPASRRRLYLTLLGVCGKTSDLPLLEEMLKSDDRKMKAGLDAMIACYLTLKGPDGLTLIEDLFLKNAQAEYADTYAAIMALRFHGTEGDTIPRARIVKSLHYMLERPQLADLVIPDLARWEDWSQVERLVTLFKEADEKSSWVRVPVVNYLRACPLPQAEKYIQELEKLDPESVKRANTFFPFTPASGSSPPAAGGGNGSEEEAAGEGSAAAAPIPAVSPTGGGRTDLSEASVEVAAARPMRPTDPLAARRAASPQPADAPNPLLIAGVSWAGGAALLATMWIILGGAAGRTA